MVQYGGNEGKVLVMKRHHIPIQWKMTLLSFGVVAFTLLIATVIFIGKAIDIKENELGNQALVMARTVAQLPIVQEQIHEPEGWKEIQPVVEQIRTVNGSDYIVVLNMNRIRYSHPSPKQLGTVSSGKDEGPAFAEHSYVSKAKGEKGIAIRGFVPIMDGDQRQVGVVIVGMLMPSVAEIINSIKNELMITTGLVSLFGIIGSWLLARKIKEDTFNLEPYEIGKLLVERTAVFQAINEGIIAVNSLNQITVFNEKAKELLAVDGELEGKGINEILHDSRLVHILCQKEDVFNEEVRINHKVIFVSKVSIKVNGRIVGNVAIFQDRTEITKVAEELTGVKGFVEALRVQNHEHQNRLHTIAGLIQLDEKEKALQYIFHSTEENMNLVSFLTKRISYESVSGLLLGKIRRGKEMDVKVSIHPDSSLHSLPPLVDEHDLVVVIGNLLENALYAVQKSTYKSKVVNVSITEGENLILIVQDNGIGIRDEDLQAVYQKGFTTKGNEGSGLGLHLVKNTVEKANGSITIQSSLGEGTVVKVVIPMTGGMHDE